MTLLQLVDLVLNIETTTKIFYLTNSKQSIFKIRIQFVLYDRKVKLEYCISFVIAEFQIATNEDNQST